MPQSKLTAAVLGLTLAWIGPTAFGSAQSSAVPGSLQAELLAKLEGYDRSFAARAGSVAKVMIVVKSGDAKSELSATEMKSALKRIEQIGGLPHQDSVVAYAGTADLVKRCQQERVAIVFLAASLDDAVESIAGALAGSNVLSVGADPSYVAKGIVLGFELESGRPRIVINLEQARRQNVDFSSNVLRLMRVYR